jgi:hypothetical protein
MPGRLADSAGTAFARAKEVMPCVACLNYLWSFL